MGLEDIDQKVLKEIFPNCSQSVLGELEVIACNSAKVILAVSKHPSMKDQEDVIKYLPKFIIAQMVLIKEYVDNPLKFESLQHES